MKSIDQISLEVLESGYDNALDAIRKGVVAGVAYGLQRAAKRANAYGEMWRTSVLMDNSHTHHREAADKIEQMILSLIPKDSA
jgi:pantothenate kinase type III